MPIQNGNESDMVNQEDVEDEESKNPFGDESLKVAEELEDYEHPLD